MKRAKKKPREVWQVVVTVKGSRPDIRSICGDTMFLRCEPDQEASWTTPKRVKRKLRK